MAPAIELTAPDLIAWRAGNTGVPGVHVFDSGRPGPRILVQALTHGNEICGAIALDWLFREGVPTPPIGRLTIIFANLSAFDRFDPKQPSTSRFVDEDLNRVWGDGVLFGPRETREVRRARELQPFVDESDLVLDIHSMSEPCRPLMVCGTLDKNAEFARELGMPADLLIDTGHPGGLRMVDRGGFGDPFSPKRALLIECGQHWERASAEVAIDALVRFLALTGVVSKGWAAERVRLPLPPVQRVVRVTQAIVARSLSFRFLVPTSGLGVIEHAGTPIAIDGREVFTAPYDDTVLVMPSPGQVRIGTTMVRLGRFE